MLTNEVIKYILKGIEAEARETGMTTELEVWKKDLSISMQVNVEADYLNNLRSTKIITFRELMIDSGFSEDDTDRRIADIILEEPELAKELGLIPDPKEVKDGVKNPAEQQ